MSEVLVRELKDYRWVLDGKKVILANKVDKTQIVLDKVRLMSFMKFAVNCIDKMRIEEGKQLRARIRNVRKKYIERRKKK